MTREAEVAVALKYLAQSIAQGRMGKDEARVVAEHLPNVMQAIALQVDGTIGQAVRRAAGDEGIPSREVVNAILMLSLYEGEPRSLPEASMRLRQAFSRFVHTLFR